MEGADFDEDVVFKGSPLYQHLEDAGFAQLDSAERQRDPGGRPEEHEETQMESRMSCSCAEWIRRPFTLLLSHVGGLGAYAASTDQADAWRRREVVTVVTRGRLLEEDVELLGLFAPEVLTWAAEPLAPTSATPRGDLAARGTAGDQLDGTSVDARKPSAWLAFAAALLAVVVVWVTSPTAGGAAAVPVVWWSAAAVVAAAGALVALATTARALWRRLDGVRLERRCISTGAFAGDCAALTALAKKSLRLVQESEVITRGFTLVSASCSVRTLDLGAGAQLPMLRRSLYWALRSSTLALRDATRGLVASCPLDAEADNVTNYLCAVPLAELGLGMELHCGATVGVGAELRDETAILDRAAELTDGFSLQALKVLYQLWVGQSSEFLRRLVLALYAAPRGHEQGPRNRPSTPEHAFVSAASPRVSDSLRRLGRSFELHRVGCGGRAAEGGDRPRSAAEPAAGGPGDPRGSGGGPRSELWRLHAAVRSLQLHLKMALQDSLSLEDELERLLESGLDASTSANGSSGGVGDSEAETAAAEAAAELLSLLGPRMEAARACWDETVTRSRALRRRGDRDGAAADVPGRAEPPRSVGEDRPALVIIDDRDPIPEEQEFESFAGDPEDGPPPPGSGDPRGERRSPDPEERERLRRQLEEARREREEARRMLDELKSVLGVRTSLEQRAVWRSALFPAAAPRETSLQARPSSSAEAPTETAARSPAVDDHSRDDDDDGDGGGDGGDGERRKGVNSSRDDVGGNCEDDGGARAIGVWDAAAASAASGDEATSSAAGASEANIYSTGGCDDDDEAKRESTPSSSETKREFAAGSDVDDAKTEAAALGGGDDSDDDDANGNTSASRDYDNDADADVEGEGGETAGSDGDDAGGRGAPHDPPPASLRERLAAAQLSGWHGATRDPRSVHLTSMVATQAATLSRGLLSLQEQTFGDDGDDDDDDAADDDRESQE